MTERIAARTLIFNEKNQILLLKFKCSDEIFWLTPGGRIENDETPLNTAKRELYEETGITQANFITPHSYYFESVGSIRGISTHFKEYVFVAYTKNDQINLTHLEEDEKQIVTDIKWWNIHDFIASKEILRPHELLTVLTSLSIHHKHESNVATTAKEGS